MELTQNKPGDMLALLKSGRDAWNHWREHNPGQHVDLSQAKLDGLNLSGFDLRRVNLVGASLIDANLQDADLSGADCRNARFIAAILTGTRFDEANLDGADFLTAVVSRISLRGLDLRKIKLDSFDLRGANLDGADLRRQQLAGFDLARASMRGADLEEVNLEGANLSHVNLSDAVLDKARLEKANFNHAKLVRASLKAAQAAKASFKESNLESADLRNCDFSGACLDEAQVTGARFAGCIFSGWSIRKIRCDHCSWDLRGQDLVQFKRGEFEKLYGSKPNIQLKYPGGLRPHEMATLPFLMEHLAASKWGTIVRLRGIEDYPGGSVVTFCVEEMGDYEPAELLHSLQQEAETLQFAQLELRENHRLRSQLRGALSAIKEQFWPRMLELAAEHQAGQQRHLTVMFMDLKDFSRWQDSELAAKLELFRGLLKPVLNRWQAAYPNMEGDSLRVTFNNAGTGVRCALMVQDVLSAAGFRLRIGMDLGPVFVSQNAVTSQADLGGSALNYAARLEESAAAGEVLVSERVRHFARSVGPDIQFVEKQVILQKGIGELESGAEITAFSVIRRKDS
jgi:uncharacterized protein YjbI with pentapeptide repeats/class 3 adenylate cyclase